MLFTEGEDREYERLMQEKPGFGRDKPPVFRATKRRRDCPYCLYYSEKDKKCGLEKCTVFEE